MMNNVTLQLWTFFIIAIIFIIVVLILIQQGKDKKYKKATAALDREKNLINSIPITKELIRVEVILKNEKLEERYHSWNERYKNIQNVQIPKITDYLLELDLLVEQRDYYNLVYKMVRAEMEVYRVKAKTNGLLEEIKEVTGSEEKNRNIITKQKATYRSLKYKYHDNSSYYGAYTNPVEMQFENIEKRFTEFEKSMEISDYDEVSHIVKALNDMLNHMGVIIEELPQVVLMSTILIPKKISEVTKVYEKLQKEGYILDFLKFEFNTDATTKKISHIQERTNVLNLEDSTLELKTILDYFDGLFTDFEKEKDSKNNFKTLDTQFRKRLSKTNVIMENITSKIDEIKYNYDLSEEEAEKLNLLGGELTIVNGNYKKLDEEIRAKNTAHSILTEQLNKIIKNLSKIENGIESCFKNIDNLRDDERRAYEELKEIENLLHDTKYHLREYKLPLIPAGYYIQLREAEEAVLEITKELSKKPISIKVLNTRVDNARDLVFKAYNTANEMIKTAILAERAIVYGNRYKSSKVPVEQGLNNAEILFTKGDYKKALETSINSIDLIEPGIYARLLEVYNKEAL